MFKCGFYKINKNSEEETQLYSWNNIGTFIDYYMPKNVSIEREDIILLIIKTVKYMKQYKFGKTVIDRYFDWDEYEVFFDLQYVLMDILENTDFNNEIILYKNNIDSSGVSCHPADGTSLQN